MGPQRRWSAAGRLPRVLPPPRALPRARSLRPPPARALSLSTLSLLRPPFCCLSPFTPLFCLLTWPHLHARSGPTTVLVLSLLFIAFVVLLHIWGKFRKG